MDPDRCPRCTSATRISGSVNMPSETRPVSLLVPHKIRFFRRKAGVTLDRPDFGCCPACGLVWSSVPPAELRDYIAAYGAELLKQDLELQGADPGQVLPEAPEARKAAQAVAEIDGLVRARALSRAVDRYRDLTRTTTHHAGCVVGKWRALSLAAKLSLFGWPPKGKDRADEPEAEGHPLRDSLFDG